MKRLSFRSYFALLRQMLTVDWKLRLVFFFITTLLLFVFLWQFNLRVSEHVASLPPSEAMVHNGIYGFLKIVIILALISLTVGYSSASSLNWFRAFLPSFFDSRHTTLTRSLVIFTRSYLLIVIPILLAMLVADLLQWLFIGQFPIDYYARIDWNLVDKLALLPAEIEHLLVSVILISVVFVLLSNAWFFLCSTIYIRHPFLFGFLILWFVEQLLSIILFFVTDLFSEYMKWADGNCTSLDNIDLMYKCCNYCDIFLVIIIILTLIFYPIAYIRLKKK